ncbi:phosphatase PAP2 family protein [Aureibacter tunicatorum]|uniref:Undecaprenyl-diphosphatase n=1 Tax=Aureibacter tunicatorum TaxID=866807 RepID=A0AAE3XQU1_9BACT|nr:phosphatase PAP2 family protein [Aureibacter tunicatorum]MDR6239719.1 undecaprenyl-diphosphatase [Aureibacter tunicatorum]BDD04195.1 phosphatase PAP2 family protein [Aureibacter tunicatorum]
MTFLEKVIQWDKELFLYLNGKHVDFLDPIMQTITASKTWIPFYLILVGFVYYKYRKHSWLIFLGVGLVILLADQTTSGFMKPFFERFRPCHDPEIKDLVHLVKGCGGRYGFASSHAANTFGLATFLYVRTHKQLKWMGWLFLWAAIVSYSRIYVGVHYPLDIIVGGLIGVISGLIGSYFVVYTSKKLKIDDKVLK